MFLEQKWCITGCFPPTIPTIPTVPGYPWLSNNFHSNIFEHVPSFPYPMFRCCLSSGCRSIAGFRIQQELESSQQALTIELEETKDSWMQDNEKFLRSKGFLEHKLRDHDWRQHEQDKDKKQIAELVMENRTKQDTIDSYNQLDRDRLEPTGRKGNETDWKDGKLVWNQDQLKFQYVA